MARMARQTRSNECRRCSTFCDRVIQPASCVASDCAFLYQFDDPISGQRYMGCIAEGLRVGDRRGTPLRRCAFEVEQAYEGASDEGSRCSNRRFFDAPDAGPDAIRAFDLRNGLSPA
jgi:hypothetical protein